MNLAGDVVTAGLYMLGARYSYRRWEMQMHVDRIKPNWSGITPYLENLRKGQYQIPTFQREVDWDRDRVKRLWDSVY